MFLLLKMYCVKLHSKFTVKCTRLIWYEINFLKTIPVKIIFLSTLNTLL